jgi:hypothetical protein
LKPGVLAAALFVGAIPDRAHALTTPSREEAVDERTRDRRLYFAMWTLHFRELERGLDTNRAIGIAWDGYYGATFINSFGDRAFSAGVQGTLARWEPGRMAVGLGYRAGLITGYDERFIPLAGKTPVVPLVQPLFLVDGQRLGLELSYSGVIASAALNVRF